MEKVEKKKIASGVSTLDMISDGGFPLGSFIVLLGEPGSGHHEFAYTSSIMTIVSESMEESSPEEVKTIQPEETYYIALGRTKEDIIEEVYTGHSTDLSNIFEDNVNFEDLSKGYGESSSGTEIVKKIQEILGGIPENSLVILHTLTDLARLYPNSPEKLAPLLLNLRQGARKKKSLIYGILSRGVLRESEEKNILSTSDGVLSFQWEQTSSAERKRTMRIEKFRGILNRVGSKVPIFDVSINPQVGLTISKLSKIKKVE